MIEIEILRDVALFIISIGLLISCILMFFIHKTLRIMHQGFDQVQSDFKQVGQKIPDRQVVEQMGLSNKSLSEALNANKDLLEKLPMLVSNKVADQISIGLRPLQEEIQQSAQVTSSATFDLSESLSKSHDQFLQALLTINDEGQFSEWLSGLQRVVNPLEIAANSIENQYAMVDTLLSQSSEVSARWSGHWDEVSSSFSRFSERFDSWAATEASHNRDMEQRIMARLEEVSNTNHLLSNSLDELQASRTKLIESSESLSDSVQHAISLINEIGDSNEKLQARHLEILNSQKDFQDRTMEWQEKLQGGVDEFSTNINQLAANFNENIEKDLDIQKQFYKQSKALLDGLTNDFENGCRKQTELIDKQTQILEKFRKYQIALPNKSLQIAQFIMLTLIFGLGLKIVGVNYGF